MKFVPQFLLTVGLVLGLAGCSSFRAPEKPKYTLRFHEEAIGDQMPDSHIRIVTVRNPHLKIGIDPHPTLTEANVLKAELQPTPGGDAILVHFDSHGASLLTEMTARLRGHYFVILVNDRPVAAILCDKIISDGQFQVVGDLTDKETKGVVDAINKLSAQERDTGDTRYAP
jgi:hypothetical protein